MKLRKICVVGAYQIKNTKTPDDTRIETRIILIIQQKLKTRFFHQSLELVTKFWKTS